MPQDAACRIAILEALLSVAREAEALLSQSDPDPERIAQLMIRRSQLFDLLQQSAQGQAPGTETPGAGTREAPGGRTQAERALARELLALGRRCAELAQRHLKALATELGQVRSQQRGLFAYGYADPRHAPRGAFVDTTHAH